MVETTRSRDCSLVLFELAGIQFSTEKLLTKFRDRVRATANVHDKPVVGQFPAFSANVLGVVIHSVSGFVQFVSDGFRRVISVFTEKFQDSLISLRQPASVLSHKTIALRDAHYSISNPLLGSSRLHYRTFKPILCPQTKQLCGPTILLGLGTTGGPSRSAESRHSVGVQVGRIREPVDPAPARSGSSNQGAVTVYEDNSRGFNCSDRPAESTDNYQTCPHCETLILALMTCGPSEHRISPCGCRVSPLTVRELPNVDVSSTPTRQVGELEIGGGQQ